MVCFNPLLHAVSALSTIIGTGVIVKVDIRRRRHACVEKQLIEMIMLYQIFYSAQ